MKLHRAGQPSHVTSVMGKVSVMTEHGISSMGKGSGILLDRHCVVVGPAVVLPCSCSRARTRLCHVFIKYLPAEGRQQTTESSRHTGRAVCAAKQNVSCALPSKRTVAVCLLLSPPAITTPLASSDQSRHPPRNRCSSSPTYHIPPTTPADRQYERSRRFHPGQGYVVVVVAVAAISFRKRRYRRGFPQRILTDHHCSAVPPVPARQGAVQVPSAAAV
jgi:hypothetical protein